MKYLFLINSLTTLKRTVNLLLISIFLVFVVAGMVSGIILLDRATPRHHACAVQAPINVPDDAK